jgi:DNA-binding HxlR family transcriptional regulator
MDTTGKSGIYVERAACPLYTALGVIGGRWKPMLYRRLTEQSRGLGDLRRSMPGVTTRVLREQLRQLVADGVIVRQELTPARLGVRYRVTPYGRTLSPVFESLWQWGRRHLDRAGGPRGTRVLPPVSGPP